MDTSPGRCSKAGIVWGNLQYMGQGRRWPDNNDHLGNEQFWGRSCMAEQTWGFSVMSCGGVDNGIFHNWCHCMIHCQLRRAKVSTVNGLKTNNILFSSETWVEQDHFNVHNEHYYGYFQLIDKEASSMCDQWPQRQLFCWRMSVTRNAPKASGWSLMMVSWIVYMYKCAET